MLQSFANSRMTMMPSETPKFPKSDIKVKNPKSFHFQGKGLTIILTIWNDLCNSYVTILQSINFVFSDKTGCTFLL